MVAPLLAVAAVAATPTPAEAIVLPQTRKTETLKATFKTDNQSLWGQGTATPPAKQTVPLFDTSWNGRAGGGEVSGFSETFEAPCLPDFWNMCDYTIGGDFGADGSAYSSGNIGMSLDLKGMSGGKVGVDYPVEVDVTMPGDKTFGAGDTIEIGTSVAQAQPGARIHTVEPDLQGVALNGAFAMQAGFEGRVCFFSCASETANLIDQGQTSGEIFSIPTNQMTSPVGTYCFGAPEKAALGLTPHASNTRCPGNGGYLARPNPVMSTTLNPDGSLAASGEDTFAVIPVSAATWLKRISGESLPLTGDQNLGVASLEWTLADLGLNTEVSRREELSFTPKVDVTLEFPRAVSYRVLTPAPGSNEVARGTGTSVTLRSGNRVLVDVPLDQTEPFTATPSLSLSQSTLSNKVTHIIAGSGDLAVLSATVEVPGSSIWDGGSFGFGPVYRHHIPFGNTPLVVVPRSEWTLKGFNSPVLSPLTLVPAPPPEVTPARFDAVEGDPTTAPVATFTDEVTKAVPSDYAATIVWGDGGADEVAEAGVISENPDGSFTITGTHDYEQYGTYPIVVDLRTVPTGQLATNHVVTDTTAVVVDAALTGTGATNNTTASGQPVLTWSNPSPAAPGDIVATFADANPYGLLSDLSATIDWGDGTPATTGIVAGPVGGPFTVAGHHDYTELGLHTVTVTMTSKGGSTDTTTTTTLSYTNPERGTFLLGGKKATGAVTYWGAQWMRANALTSTAPASFKGFANQTAPACGTRWSAAPAAGSSSVPPGSVPTYMAVAVTNQIDKSGATASGTTDAVVIVQTDAGYGPTTGQTGTGTVVAVLCGKVG